MIKLNFFRISILSATLVASVFARPSEANALGLFGKSHAPALEKIVYEHPFAEPEKPKMVQLRDSSGFLIGGMSELFKDSGIFITNHHVIEGLDAGDWKKSLSASGVDPENQICYEFYREGSGFPGDPKGLFPLDVILSVPKNDKNIVQGLAPEIEGLDCSGVKNPEEIPYQLRPTAARKAEFIEVAGLEQEFFSFQYGTLGSVGTESTSSGRVIAHAFDGKFYLPSLAKSEDPEKTSRTTARGSGSLVYVENPAESDWGIAGVIECQVPPVGGPGKKSSLYVPGGTRVIPISMLFGPDTKAFRVSCTGAKTTEPRPRDKECIPIDGRSGGGFN